MICTGRNSISSGAIRFARCDASDHTVLTNDTVTHDAAFAAGSKLVPSCGVDSTYYLFHK